MCCSDPCSKHERAACIQDALRADGSILMCGKTFCGISRLQFRAMLLKNGFRVVKAAEADTAVLLTGDGITTAHLAAIILRLPKSALALQTSTEELVEYMAADLSGATLPGGQSLAAYMSAWRKSRRPHG